MISILPFTVLTIDTEGFHLLLKIKMNNKTANVIIDTGASKSVFDLQRIQKYVSEKNFKKQHRLSSGLGTNSLKSRLTTIRKIKIGELEVLNYQCVLLDLSHVNKSYEQIGLKPIDGILGSDLLLQLKAVIDYEKKIVKLKANK